MSLATLANIGGVPGMDLAITAGAWTSTLSRWAATKDDSTSCLLAADLARAVKDIKVYRVCALCHPLSTTGETNVVSHVQLQADELCKRCTLLLLSYRDACKGLEDTPDFTVAADEITAYAQFSSESKITTPFLPRQLW